MGIESLRDYYHSVHDSERSEVIELLSAMPDPDAARELIQVYHDCQWRNTRLQIIRALSRNTAQRSLEFLFRLAQAKEDLPIAEAAIWSLGQSHQRLAARFLVHYHDQCGELLRPAVINALGQIPERALARAFVLELPKAIAAKQSALVKSLVVALGELKVREAVPHLLGLALDRSNPASSLSALVAIGKIARDPRLVDPLESRFREDAFEYQVFTTVKTQIQFRSQWKLEDYLTRIFGSAAFHPSLPYELSHFDPNDVRAGLKLFAGPGHFERLCLALARIDFAGIGEWYLELVDFKGLAPEQVRPLLESVSAHYDRGMSGPLARVRELLGRRTADWLEAAAMSLPEAEVEFKAHFESKDFREESEQERIAAVNQLFHLGLTVQTRGARLQGVGKALEAVLVSDPSEAVRARVLRALGHLGIHSKKALSAACECLEGEDPHGFLYPSSLQFLELCPEKSAATALLRLLDRAAAKPVLCGAPWLKCVAALPSLPEAHAALDAHLRACLSPSAAPELRIEALRLLDRHPRRALVADVLRCLDGQGAQRAEDEPVRLAAVIALKRLGDESAAEPLGRLLQSEQQSLSGRALDTLTALPGMRAKRIVIDFLKERSEDPDVCDKIIRCLKAPETPNNYFTGAIDEILAGNPHHPQLDGLLLLRERLGARPGAGGGAAAPKGAEIAAVDRELAAKLAGYEGYDESVKSALRSAELPYLHREMFDEFVDKSSSVVEYCKAIDMLLEKTVGRKLLFPKLEHGLQEFQNVLHAAGLNEDFAGADWVLRQTGLEKHFNAQSLPLHKMVTVAQAIRNGRIVNDHFRTIDGLRAWAVVLLLFGRRIQGGKALIPLKAAGDEQVVGFCKKLIDLQEARNPVAHRQTVLKFVPLDEVRAEVYALLNALHKLL